MKTKKTNWKRILTVCGVLAFLAAVAYGIYYFFFAEDEAELDEDFFDEEEPDEEKPEDSEKEAAVELAEE